MPLRKPSSASLPIHIENPTRHFTNTQVVTGTVICRVPQSIEITSIIVELYGKVQTKNYVSTGNGICANVEKHVILQQQTVLFPDPSVFQLSDSEHSYTLSEGGHAYQFSVQFPDKYFNAHCAKEAKRFHSKSVLKKYYAGSDYHKPYHVCLPPSNEYRKRFDIYEKVEYYVVAKIERPAFFQVNIVEKEMIYFTPLSDAMTFSLSHIAPTGTNAHVLPDYVIVPFKLSLGGSLENNVGGSKKTLFSKLLFSSESKNALPFGLQLDFRPTLNIATENGCTSRAVYPGSSIAHHVALSLATSLSYDNIVAAMFSDQDCDIGEKDQYMLKRGISKSSPREPAKIIIRNVKVELKRKLIFSNMQHEVARDNQTLLDRNLDHKIELQDFEETNNHVSHYIVAGMLDQKHIKRESFAAFINKNDNDRYYKFELAPEWYDCAIPANTVPSFLSCNVKNDYKLRFYVTLAASGCVANTKDSVVKLSSPIVVTSNGLPYDLPPRYSNLNGK